jgi:hypothetical protein
VSLRAERSNLLFAQKIKVMAESRNWSLLTCTACMRTPALAGGARECRWDERPLRNDMYDFKENRLNVKITFSLFPT